MSHCNCEISLGFTEQKFPPGVHICQIFTDDEERQESALKYILSGLRESERAAYFSEKAQKEVIREFLNLSGVSYDQAVEQGELTLSGTNEIYFEEGRFDTDRMLKLLKQYYTESIVQGYKGARVIGEMVPEVQEVPGGEDLLEYESKVSLLLREVPVTSVCQYSAKDFSGSVIMDILKVHPYMIVRGSVVHNPFYIPPEEFLKSAP